MIRIWNLIQSHISAQYAHAVFLTSWTALWSVGTLAVGLLFSSVTAGNSFAEGLVNVVCIAAYAGIIFGLFGGMFFLMRQPKK